MDDSVDQILSEYNARQHWERREYKSALEHAAAAAEKALNKADTIGYLRMALLLAECQLELGQMQEFASSAKELSEHPALQGDPRMLVRAKVLYSRALEALGYIDEALTLAQEAAAIEVPPGLDAVDELGMLHGLVAALAESGREAEAWKYAQDMARLAAEQSDQEVAGKAYWAVGIVAFFIDDTEKGIYYHRLAAENLAPGNDVNTWALFNKGSALARLSAGVVEPETLECIERAELAMSVTGVSPLQELEISIARAHWLLLTGEAEESVMKLQQILDHRDLLPEQTVAEAEYVSALALRELGRNDEARAAADHSEKVFIVHGAHRRAVQARSVINEVTQIG